MKGTLFDIESNAIDFDRSAVHVGIHTIHCAATYDLETGEVEEFGPNDLVAFKARLEKAELLAGMNICGFDIPVLVDLLGLDPTQFKYLDTRAMSRVLHPGKTLKDSDFAFRRKHGDDALPAQYIGVHSLKAWCLRLKLGAAGKADYDGGWEVYTPEMQAYNVRDVKSNVHVLKHFLAQGWDQRVFEVESELSYHLARQQETGVGFDEDKAVELMVTLAGRRAELEKDLHEAFPPVTVEDGLPITPKRNSTCRKYKPGEPGYFEPRVKGVPYQKYKIEEFKPGSGPHIARRLKAKYDWVPHTMTPGGQASVTADILGDLHYEEAPKLAEYAIIAHILGYISEGKQAWLRLAKDGRLHGTVHATGAITHRSAHASPNLGNVPAGGKPYGKECRQLFKAGGGSVPSDYVLVGADASSLQLSIYAHFVGKFDGGIMAALCGDPDGDPHEYMRKTSGLFYRIHQKTLTYATWFGAGLYKQGQIVLADWRQAFAEGLTTKPVPSLKAAVRLGKEANGKMQANMKGYKQMLKACEVAGRRGYVRGLDGRHIPVPQMRLALLTLLQGNEAVVMKHAFLLAVDRLRNLIAAKEAMPVLWVHDELQWACHAAHAEAVGEVLTASITDTGENLGLRLRLGADYKVGSTWAETH